MRCSLCSSEVARCWHCNLHMCSDVLWLCTEHIRVHQLAARARTGVFCALAHTPYSAWGAVRALCLLWGGCIVPLQVRMFDILFLEYHASRALSDTIQKS